MKKIVLFLFFSIGLLSQAQFDNFHYSDDLSKVPTDSAMHRISKILNILREFRFQAYIQPQWQRADTSGKISTGPLGIDGVGSFQGGTFPAASNSRFLERRSRFRFSFEHKNTKDLKVLEFAFQFEAYDYTRGSIAVKEFYGRIIDPWVGWVSLQGGIFNRPVGLESTISPAFNEAPEFSRVNQTIFPNEAELGEAIVIESPAKFEKFYFRADANVVNGQGVGVGFQTGTYQSKKDFIGRIKIGKAWDLGKAKIGFNLSGTYYNGSVLQTTNYVYELQKDSIGEWTYTNIANPKMQLKKSYKREYYGAHVEFKAVYPLGSTMIRGEFFAGQQPGGQTTSLVPVGQYNAAPISDLYLRRFQGAMFCFSQSFNSKIKGHSIFHDITLKYDWYDPQVQVKGNDFSIFTGFSVTDIKYSTLGVGYSFVPYNWFKLMVWYDYVLNEKTKIPDWETDFKKDNVVTIRTQFYIDTWWFNSKSKYKDNLLLKKY